MKIDTNIVKAVEKYLQDHQIGAMDLARILKVSPATMTKWRKIGNGITEAKWDILFPMIQKYLPAERIFINDAGVAQYSSAVPKESTYFFDPRYVPAMVPIFNAEQLSGYDNMLESVMQFGKHCKAKTIEYRAKHQNKQGVFALKVGNNDLAPVLPENSTLFACTSDTPVSGNMVIFKTTDNTVRIGRYEQNNYNFRIMAVGGNKQIATGKISEARTIITWVFPVLFYEVVTF